MKNFRYLLVKKNIIKYTLFFHFSLKSYNSAYNKHGIIILVPFFREFNKLKKKCKKFMKINISYYFCSNPILISSVLFSTSASNGLVFLIILNV